MPSFSKIANYFIFSLGLLVLVSAVIGPLSMNIADVILYRTLADNNIRAVDRQKAIGYAANLMRRGGEAVRNDYDSNQRDTDMLSLIYRGLYHLRNGNINQAAAWFSLVPETPPIPKSQKSLLVSPYVDLEQSGSIVIDGQNSAWGVRGDSAPGSSIERNLAKHTIFSCGPKKTANKKASFSWNRPLNISYHHTMEVNTYVPTGTNLVIETVIDGKLLRHIEYEGKGKFEQLRITLAGEQLRFIYILVRANSEDINGEGCSAEIASVRFEKDRLIN